MIRFKKKNGLFLFLCEKNKVGRLEIFFKFFKYFYFIFFLRYIIYNFKIDIIVF